MRRFPHIGIFFVVLVLLIILFLSAPLAKAQKPAADSVEPTSSGFAVSGAGEEWALSSLLIPLIGLFYSTIALRNSIQKKSDRGYGAAGLGISLIALAIFFSTHPFIGPMRIFCLNSVPIIALTALALGFAFTAARNMDLIFVEKR